MSILEKKELQAKIIDGTITPDEIREYADMIHRILMEKVVIPFNLNNEIVVFKDHAGNPIKRDSDKYYTITKIISEVYNGKPMDEVIQNIINIGLSLEMILVILNMSRDSVELFQLQKNMEKVREEQEDIFLKNFADEQKPH